MIKLFFILFSVLYISDVYANIVCPVGQYLNNDLCVLIDNGYYGVPCNGLLPDDYTELEYIESTGEQQINTSYFPSPNTSFKFGINMTAATGGVIIGFVYGKDNEDYRIFNHTGRIYWDYNASRLIGGQMTPGIYYDMEAGNNYVKQNGTLVLSGTKQTSNDDYEILIFSKGSYGAKGKIYYLEIYENSDLVRNMIPARRNADGVLGMYDLVNDIFYTNVGSGEFIAGGIVGCMEQKLCDIGYYCVGGMRLPCVNAPDNSIYTTAGWTNVDCPWTCQDTYYLTGINTCGMLCNAGATTLRTETGVVVPLFMTRNTTPAINIGFNDNVCYADLLPGVSDNAINIEYNGMKYHTITYDF